MTDAFRHRDAELDALVRAAVSAHRAAHPGHPGADELADHCLGLLAPAAEERLEEHLAVCAECTQAVLDLQVITAPAAAGQEPSDAEISRAWKELAARTDGRRARPGIWTGTARTVAWALAASVLIAVGLLAWDLSLRRSLERARQPRADLQLVDLAPVESGVERGPEHPAEVVIRPGVARLVLLLDLGDLRSFPHYGLTLQAPDGRLVWQASDVRRGEDGAFVVEVPAETLAMPGSYEIRLHGRRGAEAVILADYVLRMRR